MQEPDSGQQRNDTDAGVDPDSVSGTPRWVKVFGTIAVVVILLFVILLVSGRGEHGPGLHTALDTAPPLAVVLGLPFRHLRSDRR